MRPQKLFTLIFVKKNKEILLGHKTRGLGKGLWNGFGGKVENETLLNCAKRELYEECSLLAENLNHLGVVKYEVVDEDVDHIVHVFTCTKYTGTEQRSEEMDPIRWFNFKDVPYEKMWPCAKKWWPYMLSDKYFSVHCIYNDGNIISNNVLGHGSINHVFSELSL
ncbi:unnamed protein product [Brassicogethes aeneus]|uniref:Oxidized purine nucleoside triphosphate hydrolase n=1 Tax=Brassicogethes aeneus TaxID=1431903 RepID=A0A9P0BHZ5_BRAAE|nr:unnamed protein product [Brassicogethes aeneus]